MRQHPFGPAIRVVVPGSSLQKISPLVCKAIDNFESAPLYVHSSYCNLVRLCPIVLCSFLGKSCFSGAHPAEETPTGGRNGPFQIPDSALSLTQPPWFPNLPVSGRQPQSWNPFHNIILKRLVGLRRVSIASGNRGGAWPPTTWRLDENFSPRSLDSFELTFAESASGKRACLLK